MVFELSSPRGRQAVVLGASVILSGSPFRLQLAVLLQTVQRREQRSRIDPELILAEDGESMRDSVAVHRLAREDRQNHQIERALGNIQLLHTPPLGFLDETEGLNVALGCPGRLLLCSRLAASDARAWHQPLDQRFVASHRGRSLAHSRNWLGGTRVDSLPEALVECLPECRTRTASNCCKARLICSCSKPSSLVLSTGTGSRPTSNARPMTSS